MNGWIGNTLFTGEWLLDIFKVKIRSYFLAGQIMLLGGALCGSGWVCNILKVKLGRSYCLVGKIMLSDNA